ncbi:MAG TPA: hypothetical protein DCP85_05600 [Elusimicrobia bacterium]|nr:hypothetical protein [Elusimicrobiota bacterium]
MKRWLLGVLLFFLCPLPVDAVELAIFISKDIVMYREAASALEKQLGADKAKIYIPGSEDHPAIETVLRQIEADRPALIVAIGSKAAVESARKFPDTPIVYTMVVYPERLGLVGHPNLFGVSWLPSPGLLAEKFRLLLPQARRIGMLSSLPEASWAQLSRQCENQGLDLIVAQIEDNSELPQGLRKLAHKVDALWMGSDPSLANESSFNILRTYALQNRLPLLVPFRLPGPDKAFAGISISPELTALAARQLILQLLKGAHPKEPLVFTRDVELTLDRGIAKSIGLSLPRPDGSSAAKTHE